MVAMVIGKNLSDDTENYIVIDQIDIERALKVTCILLDVGFEVQLKDNTTEGK